MKPLKPFLHKMKKEANEKAFQKILLPYKYLYSRMLVGIQTAQAWVPLDKLKASNFYTSVLAYDNLLEIQGDGNFNQSKKAL